VLFHEILIGSVMRRIDENPPERFPDRPLNKSIHPWWIARVRSRQEKALADDLQKLDIEYYLPMYVKRTRRKDTNKLRKSILPLFAGYLCFSSPRTSLTAVFDTGRTCSILSVLNQKRLISELNWIYLSNKKGLTIEPAQRTMEKGTRIKVIDGPLSGYCGLLVKYKNESKLILTVDELGEAAVTIDIACVRAL
jgi:transcription antitermination factor NusG